MKKIGLIGYGRIGSYLFGKAAKDGLFGVGFIYEMVEEKAKSIESSILVKDPKKIGEKVVDLVVEAADFRAVGNFAPELLRKNDMLILSVAALADEKLAKQLERTCKQNRTSLYIPHGALLGMDGLQDARDTFHEVSIVTRKHPRNIDFSFTDEFKQEDIVKETTLYEGPARGICKLFPRNVNSHAVLAMSGIGFDKTMSKLIADPGSDMASHHIVAKGKNNVFEIVTSSAIKGVTGEYTLASVYGTIKRIITDKKYGINIY